MKPTPERARKAQPKASRKSCKFYAVVYIEKDMNGNDVMIFARRCRELRFYEDIVEAKNDAQNACSVQKGAFVQAVRVRCVGKPETDLGPHWTRDE